MVFTKESDICRSRRLPRVTLPLSRELKWSWPAVLFRTLPVRVTPNRLDSALCVFISGISLHQAFASLRLSNDACQLSALACDRLLDLDWNLEIKLGHKSLNDLGCYITMAFFATT